MLEHQAGSVQLVDSPVGTDSAREASFKLGAGREQRIVCKLSLLYRYYMYLMQVYY